MTASVVRVGSTVRRPAQPQSAAVADHLRHLGRVGSDSAPRFLGRDVLDHLPGDVAGDLIRRRRACLVSREDELRDALA